MSHPGGHIDDLPEPPWAEDVDLGVFANIELPVRLLLGPVFADLDAVGRWALIRLVFAAWHERPAGSLPANQRVLADAAGFGADLGAWGRAEEGVMAQWRYCADGRFYFLPIEDVVTAAFARREDRRAGDTVGKARRRMRGELKAAGVPTARLRAPQIDEFVATFRGRGMAEKRGGDRREHLVLLAGEFGWLPSNLTLLRAKEE